MFYVDFVLTPEAVNEVSDNWIRTMLAQGSFNYHRHKVIMISVFYLCLISSHLIFGNVT